MIIKSIATKLHFFNLFISFKFDSTFDHLDSCFIIEISLLMDHDDVGKLSKIDAERNSEQNFSSKTK